MNEARRFRTRVLSDVEAREVLTGLHLGRLAYVEGARIEIRPVGYAFDGEWLFGRMGPGSKVKALLHHRWVTFQVDDVESLWSWRSILVHGALHFLEAGGGAEAERVRGRALEALAAAFPGIGTDDDPGHFRGLIFGITPQEVSGLEGYLDEASPASGAGGPSETP
jgi:uncharacterized protein